MLDKGANDFNEGIENASERGHIVQLMLDKGSNNFNKVMRNAAGKGHRDIVQLMKNILNYISKK